MTRAPRVATIKNNILSWVTLEGRKLYCPVFGKGMKFSRRVFTTKTEALLYRTEVLIRYEKLKMAKGKPRGKIWLS